MRFRRTELIKLIDTEINRREKAAADAHTKALRDYHQVAMEWRDKYGPHWMRFAREIIERLQAGLQTTPEMVPEDIRDYNGLKWFDKKEPSKDATPTKLGDLPAMRAMLEGAVDEEVTVSELQRIGFKVPSIFG